MTEISFFGALQHGLWAPFAANLAVVALVPEKRYAAVSMRRRVLPPQQGVDRYVQAFPAASRNAISMPARTTAGTAVS